jgi:hypothetical protein
MNPPQQDADGVKTQVESCSLPKEAERKVPAFSLIRCSENS